MAAIEYTGIYSQGPSTVYDSLASRMDNCQFNQANQNGHMNQQIDLSVVSLWE
jgi:hypothetical protein